MQKQYLHVAKEAARIAGAHILSVAKSGNLETEEKDNGEGPVTLADKLSNVILCGMLHNAFPEHGILTEEHIELNTPLEQQKLLSERLSTIMLRRFFSGDILRPKKEGERPSFSSLEKALEQWRKREYTWMIDPLDSTRCFVRGDGEYGINIGLTHEGIPILGVVYSPLTDTMYFAEKEKSAYVQKGETSELITVSSISTISHMKPILSPSNPDPVLKKLLKKEGFPEPLSVGGMGLRICRVAEGKADLFVYRYPFTRAHLWDSCAGDVILHEAGGKLTTVKETAIDYQHRTGLENGVVATNGKQHDAVLNLLRKYF